MTKLYFKNLFDEICSDKKSILSEMESEGTNEMIVYEAKAERIEGVFFCKEHYTWGESGECGKSCKEYSPRNKKSGCCKYFSNINYEPTNETVLLKLKK